MKTVDLLLKRTSSDSNRTIGDLHLRVNDSLVAVLKTLELPWLGNQRNISCIPKGSYELVVHNSPTFKWSLLVKDVPNRSAILIHVGNYTREIRGCILVGLYHDDIDGDGITDVVHSGRAIDILKHYIKAGDKIILNII